ncbi:MAG: hypothetical protein CVT98_01985 [Bacteroidetes bacterium HGW-Bacteroidetes-15]|nr:MAG: hypothetical protein CVT98_01985 [Bacteroidetes bacterium HGW-Bacteroidetes-15]
MQNSTLVLVIKCYSEKNGLGNTGSTSTAIVLSDNWNNFKQNKNIVISVFGCGYSSGAILAKKKNYYDYPYRYQNVQPSLRHSRSLSVEATEHPLRACLLASRLNEVNLYVLKSSRLLHRKKHSLPTGKGRLAMT